MSYQRDLLYSGGSARSVTLAQPASGYSRIVQTVGPSGYFPNVEFVVTANCNNFLINRGHSVYSTTMYPVWPYRIAITNNTKSLSSVNFQLLQQGGSANPSTFGWSNTASNIKWLGKGHIYGEQPASGITATGLGSPGAGWREYNETVLFSASAAVPNPGTITLSEPVTAFSRLKIGLGLPNGEGCTVMEVGIPVSSASYIPLESYWGNSTGSFIWSLHRYKMNGWSTMTPVSGKAFQLGTGAANPYSTTGNYTSTEAYIRRPITRVWGINRK